MEIALALLAFSAPITAGIIVWTPRKSSSDRVSPREFGEVVAKLDGVISTLNEVRCDVQKIWEHLT
jgi:hypothetical protein